MAKVLAVITRSLRLLKAIDAASAAPAIDVQTGLEALNAMLTRWEANGLALGWANATLTDADMPTPDEAEEAIAYNLAVTLGPEYPEPSSWGEIKERARQGLAELRRDRLTEMPLRLASDLPPTCGRWNIFTDSPNE